LKNFQKGKAKGWLPANQNFSSLAKESFSEKKFIKIVVKSQLP